jgi:hypothetical protein
VRRSISKYSNPKVRFLPFQDFISIFTHVARFTGFRWFFRSNAGWWTLFMTSNSAYRLLSLLEDDCTLLLYGELRKSVVKTGTELSMLLRTTIKVAPYAISIAVSSAIVSC